MITIQIAGEDKTKQVSWESLVWNQALTHQVDSLEFEIKNYEGKVYKPSLADEVLLYNGADKVFGGVIVQIDEKTTAAKLQTYKITCKDYTHLMDRKLVYSNYSNQTVSQIIASINSTYLTGFTTNNVNCSVVIKYVAFNYEAPSKCLQQLADLVGYDWYVDEDKDIHFFAKNDNTAPFELNDTEGNFNFDSLQIRRDIKQLRNSVYVRGGEYDGDSYTENFTGDGSETLFRLGYKYSGYSLTVGGAAKTVGIDNLDDPDDYDALYNYQEKTLKFATAPAASAAIAFSGLPKIPVIVHVYDLSSIGDYGEYQLQIKDNSIKSKEGARQRAAAELIKYGEQLNEGGFVTIKSGLRAGMSITIDSTIRGVSNEEFLITKIRASMITPERLQFECTIASKQTYGIIDFLQSLLISKDKELVINADEVIDTVYNVYETINVAQAATVSLEHNLQQETINLSEATDPRLNDPPVWVAGPYRSIIWHTDHNRPAFCDTGCLLAS